MSDSEETSSSEFLIESDSDTSSSDENSNTGLYKNEPEYSKEECKKRKLDSSSDRFMLWCVVVDRLKVYSRPYRGRY